MFKSGDKVDPYLLADNEVVLRNISFIDDARLYVSSSKTNSDSVDIIVVTKDVWTIGINADISSLSDYILNVYDADFMGLGRRLDNTILISPYNAKTGYKGRYRVENLYGTFISSEVNYVSTISEETTQINFRRNFISTKIKFAGGLDIYKTTSMQWAKNREQLTILSPTTKNVQDFWLGHAFILNDNNPQSLFPKKIIVSGRYIRNHYETRPYVDMNTNHQFFNSNLLLGNITIMRQNFYKGKMIYGFGRTEDIPYGQNVKITYGKEYNEFYRRNYFGASASKAIYTSSYGYFFGSFEYGSFFNKKQMEQGCIKADLHYFTDLFMVKNNPVRQFFIFKYTYGLRRFSVDSLDINNNAGIRGFSSDIAYGNNRFTATSETVFFTPWIFYGFRFAFYSFADFAYIGNQKNIFRNSFYSGFGFGVRIKNENLVFKTIEIRFAIYPLSQFNKLNYNFNISHERGLRLEQFEGSVPELIKFE